MKLKKIVLTFATFALMLTAIPQTGSAQWSLGGSYEIRNEDPKNGFGVRLERAILQKIPVVNLGIRGHFSYFNEENSFDPQTGSGTITQEITSYDYGLAGVVGVSVGPISPYAGLGLGSSTLDVQYSDVLNDGNDNAVYWNSFVGAKVSPIPAIKPFVEYRFESVNDFEDLNTNTGSIDKSNGRLIFGVSLSF